MFKVGDKIIPKYTHSSSSRRTVEAINRMNSQKLKYLVIQAIDPISGFLYYDEENGFYVGPKYWTHYKAKDGKSHLPQVV